MNQMNQQHIWFISCEDSTLFQVEVPHAINQTIKQSVPLLHRQHLEGIYFIILQWWKALHRLWGLPFSTCFPILLCIQYWLYHNCHATLPYHLLKVQSHAARFLCPSQRYVSSMIRNSIVYMSNSSTTNPLCPMCLYKKPTHCRLQLWAQRFVT